MYTQEAAYLHGEKGGADAHLPDRLALVLLAAQARNALGTVQCHNNCFRKEFCFGSDTSDISQHSGMLPRTLTE